MARGQMWRRKRSGRKRRSKHRLHRARQATLLAIAVLAVVGTASGIRSSTLDTTPQLVQSPDCPVLIPYRSAFHAAARDTRLPYALLVALGYRESSLDPSARSDAGAEGILQLMPATARELRLDPRKPESNILAGARYLRRMLDRFGGDLDLALAAYNAGPKAVARAGGAPDGATLTYVANVRGSWHDLRACR